MAVTRIAALPAFRYFARCAGVLDAIYDDDLSVRRDIEPAQLLGLDRGRSIADFLFGD